ncbi:MAG: hypothetical protein J6K50_02800 [Clostridia bacterium]|nr:hypothetical protein [Clostridia bacterium]
MKEVKDTRKILRKIRRSEAELAYATPARAARLTSRIVRLKATVFDDIR